MGQKIWGVLAEYAGHWVAVDSEGVVIARTPTLSELRLTVSDFPRPLTMLYASEPGR